MATSARLKAPAIPGPSNLRPCPGVLLVMALVAALSACNSKPGNDVVAQVNGKKIPRSEMEKYYRNQTADSPQQPAQPMSEEQATSLRLSILKELIDNEI